MWALEVLQAIKKEFGDPVEMIGRARELYIEYDWGSHSFDYFTEIPVLLGVLCETRRHGLHPKEAEKAS